MAAGETGLLLQESLVTLEEFRERFCVCTSEQEISWVGEKKWRCQKEEVLQIQMKKSVRVEEESWWVFKGKKVWGLHTVLINQLGSLMF